MKNVIKLFSTAKIFKQAKFQFVLFQEVDHLTPGEAMVFLCDQTCFRLPAWTPIL